jgi:hypothetical protein
MWPFDHLLEAWTFARTKFPEPERGAYSPDLLARKALEIAISQIGRGEISNNEGPDIEKYIAPARTPQNWCAGFSGWCYEEAAAELGVKLPFKRSLGAKALGKNVAAVGRRFTDPYQAKPGDLIIFDRGTTGSWTGHVGLVEKVDELTGVVHTVEGNSAPVVRRRIHNIASAGDRFSFFASIRG